MNNHNDCQNRREVITVYLLGELQPEAADELKKHIDTCKSCQSFYQALADEEKTIHSAFKVIADRGESLQDRLIKQFARYEQVASQTDVRSRKSIKIIRRTIMKSRITKLAAAAVIIIAALIYINQVGSPIESTAFADVMENIQKARTLTYQSVFTTADQETQVARTMVLEPHLMRVELPDGRIWILDHGQGKTLLLDSTNKQAVMSSTPQKTLDLYNTFQQFRNYPDFSVSRIGQRTVDGMKAIGFQLKREKDEDVIIVWANPQNSLPIRIEQTAKDKDGKIIKSVTTNIIFDAKLDESLFRLDTPEGYSRSFVDGPAERSLKLKKRSQTASNMMKILLNCLVYAQDHEGKWPDSLQDLTQYGLSKELLINPRQPERENGYVYLKPNTPISPQQVVLYEAYDSWDDGINVGYADGHVEFIEKESHFKNDLKEQVEPR